MPVTNRNGSEYRRKILARSDEQVIKINKVLAPGAVLKYFTKINASKYSKIFSIYKIFIRMYISCFINIRRRN